MSPGHKNPGPRRFHGFSLRASNRTHTDRLDESTLQSCIRAGGSGFRDRSSPTDGRVVASSLGNCCPFELACPYRKIRILGLVPVEVNAGDLAAGTGSQPDVPTRREVSPGLSRTRSASVLDRLFSSRLIDPGDSRSLLGRNRAFAFGGPIPSFLVMRKRRAWQKAAEDDS
jgi:hypothetical protein